VATDEPQITINGTQLTEAQAITTRVAIVNFLIELQDDDFVLKLGPIGALYKARLTEINALIHSQNN
jgi:hypothetical protein